LIKHLLSYRYYLESIQQVNRKKSFSHYLNGLSAQDEGEYAEALNNYYQALQIEEDLYDRSIILYNIGLIYSKMGII
jgi:tetratricopeptide (TPR) repeat protein